MTETNATGHKLYNDHYLHLHFEDLIAHPLEVIKRVWAFLGATPDVDGLEEAIMETFNVNRDARWQAQKAGEIARSIPKGMKGSWQSFFSTRDRAVFKEAAGRTLIKWGYEEDLGW